MKPKIKLIPRIGYDHEHLTTLEFLPDIVITVSGIMGFTGYLFRSTEHQVKISKLSDLVKRREKQKTSVRSIIRNTQRLNKLKVTADSLNAESYNYQINMYSGGYAADQEGIFIKTIESFIEHIPKHLESYMTQIHGYKAEFKYLSEAESILKQITDYEHDNDVLSEIMLIEAALHQITENYTDYYKDLYMVVYYPESRHVYSTEEAQNKADLLRESYFLYIKNEYDII